ncbi:MAG: TadE/TadG family type IV pilus assembly protein [Chloroflexota bacterium]
MRRFSRPLRCLRSSDVAQALVEFAFVLPVTLTLLLGTIDLGRAFVYGVAVQNGAREGARLAARASLDLSASPTPVPDAVLWDAAVLRRLVDASAPALCTAITTTGRAYTCGGDTWTITMLITATDSTTYSSISSARTAGKLDGAEVTMTASGSVALFPGVNAGGFGVTGLPQISVQGRASMVIL